MENWENIKSSPAKEIKLDAKIVDLTNLQAVHSVRAINQAVRKTSHQRRQQILERLETYNSEENRFLVHVLKDMFNSQGRAIGGLFQNSCRENK